MPARRVTLTVIHCDVCATPLADDDERTTYWEAVADAAEYARGLRWPVTTAGRWICPLGDADHQAGLDALLPPAPQPVCDGQTTLLED